MKSHVWCEAELQHSYTLSVSQECGKFTRYTNYTEDENISCMAHFGKQSKNVLDETIHCSAILKSRKSIYIFCNYSEIAFLCTVSAGISNYPETEFIMRPQNQTAFYFCPTRGTFTSSYQEIAHPAPPSFPLSRPLFPLHLLSLHSLWTWESCCHGYRWTMAPSLLKNPHASPCHTGRHTHTHACTCAICVN